MPILDVGSDQGSERFVGVDVCEPWATRADLPCDVDTLGITDEVIDDALIVASGLLYNMTLQQWPGRCLDTVRPCSRFESADTMHAQPLVRGLYTSRAAFWRCSCRGRDAYQPGCNHLSQIGLGETPITSIVEVLVDGDVVDSERYRLDDYRWLVFIPDPTGADDRQGWPCCQRMDLPTTEDGTFEVTYTVGTLPDRGGVRAAARMACELAKAWTPELAGQCQLTGRVSSMTRQQVTMTVNDPSALLDRGLTGLVDVDLWVQGVLRAHRERRAAVVVPERRRSKVRRTTS